MPRKSQQEHTAMFMDFGEAKKSQNLLSLPHLLRCGLCGVLRFPKKSTQTITTTT